MDLDLFECAFAWSSKYLGLKVRYRNKQILSRWVHITCWLHCARNSRCRSYSFLDLPRNFLWILSQLALLRCICLAGFRLLPQSKGNVGHVCNRSHALRTILTEPWKIGERLDTYGTHGQHIRSTG